MAADDHAIGHRVWMVPDGYLPVGAADGLDSHEAVCVLNTGEIAATVSLTVYLEDRDPIGPFVETVGARRTRHLRVDELVGDHGERIPHDVPYALVVRSDVAIAVQHSRMDVRSPAMSLMTTMAHPLDQ